MSIKENIDSKPIIFSFLELKTYLVLHNSGPENLQIYFHPYNTLLRTNNNQERNKVKQTRIYVKRYICSLKSFKQWILENKVSAARLLLLDVVKLLHCNGFLGSRYSKLQENRTYFINAQGSIFWINLVKFVLMNLIRDVLTILN